MTPSQSRAAGRPSGLFDYRKAQLLAFLQRNTPYVADWDELQGSMDQLDVKASIRQLQRYMRQLELEETPEGKPRVEVAFIRLKDSDGNLVRRRVFICHDTRPLNF